MDHAEILSLVLGNETVQHMVKRRDDFAAAALTGIMAGSEAEFVPVEKLADYAYRLADAMMVRRRT